MVLSDPLSVQNNSTPIEQSTPLSHPVIPVIHKSNKEETPSSSLASSDDDTVEQQPFPVYTNGNSSTRPLTSPVVHHDDFYTNVHLRPTPPALHLRSPYIRPRLRSQQSSSLSSNSSSKVQLHSPPTLKSNANQASGLSYPTFCNIDNYGRDHGGSLSQVQQISMENPTIYEIQGDQTVHNNHYSNDTGLTVLDRLAGYAMLGAIFNSSARDPPPRCHPGTRQDILQSIHDRLSDLDKTADVSWLKGAAGVGKSAIMQTIAETEAESNALGASLFLSRPNNRDDPQKVFTAIAFQLATKEPSYQQYLAQQLTADPSFLEKTMEKQFKDLIVIPFAEKQLFHDRHSCVILIDGLDECKGTREQRRIIKLIGDFVSNHRAVPLQWIIASRPEQHLLDGFSEIESLLQTPLWVKEIPIDSKQSVRDVELYLHNEFTRIRHYYRDLMTTGEEWPSEKQFLTVSRAASGLFVFASTVIRFIDNDEDPVHGLNLVLSVLLKQLNQRSSPINPLALLDVLYEQILSDISSDTLDKVRLILGYLIIRDYINQDALPPQPFWICNILGLEQHALYGALRKLRSVLGFPEPDRALKDNIHFLHASFPDFLHAQARSHVYSVNLNETATYLWRRCMTILPQWTNSSDDGVEYTWNIRSAQEIMKKQETVLKITTYNLHGFSLCWRELLQKHFDDSPTAVFHLLLPIEDLMKQLKELDFSREALLPFHDATGDLITCLEVHVHPSYCSNLIHNISLASLDRKQFLRSLYERWWIKGDGHFDLLGPKPQILGNDLKEVEKFVRTISDSAQTVLDLINGTKKSRLVVKAIGVPPKCRVWLHDVKQNQSISFPYHVLSLTPQNKERVLWNEVAALLRHGLKTLMCRYDTREKKSGS